MAPTDWFRSPDWDAAVESDFRLRLARARPHNQIQYRRIKAVALLQSGDRAKAAPGRLLLTEVIESPHAPDFEKVMALSMLAPMRITPAWQTTQGLGSLTSTCRPAVGLARRRTAADQRRQCASDMSALAVT